MRDDTYLSNSVSLFYWLGINNNIDKEEKAQIKSANVEAMLWFPPTDHLLFIIFFTNDLIGLILRQAHLTR